MNGNRLRVVVIEAEGADALIAQTLASALAALHAGPIQNAPTPPIISPPVALPALDSPRKPARPKPREPKARQAHLPLAKEGADAGTRAAVIAALEKRPMSSGEVIKVTGCTAGAVYGMLDYLRKTGVVEARPNEEGIGKKNHLVKR